MSAADPYRDRTLPEAEEKAPSAVVPGAPASEPPSLEEPTAAREPAPTKADQRPPEAVSPTGKPTGAPEDSRAQAGAYLTTAQGLRLPDTDHSLKAGERGPTLLQDHHLREKITHSTTSGSRSGSSTRVAPARTARSSATETPAG